MTRLWDAKTCVRNVNSTDNSLVKSIDGTLLLLEEQTLLPTHSWGARMRFLPKSFASTDQAPGPIIARVAPKVAKRIGTHEVSKRAKTIQSSAIATRAPMMGVHNPRARKIPAVAPTILGAVKIRGDCFTSVAIAEEKSATPASNRWTNKALPGQPFANVENKRCKSALGVE